MERPIETGITPLPQKPLGRRVLVIFNPIAGRRRPRRYAGVLENLAKLGVSVNERHTGRRGDAERFTSDVRAGEFDAIVVAGGDGTINEAVNGLRADSPPFALIPLGTANVLAAELELDPDPVHVARTIAHAEPSPIYLGKVNDRRFVMMAGIGIDAHVVQGLSPTLKHLTGKGAYAWQTLVEIARLPSTNYAVTIDGVRHDVGSAIFANGHFYGGRFVSAPEAKLEVGTLHACLLSGRGRRNFLRYGAALFRDRLSRLEDVTIIECDRADIDGPPEEPVQADGDIVCGLPTSIEADPTPFYILRPSRESLA